MTQSSPQPSPQSSPHWLSPAELRSWRPVGALLLSLPTALDAQLQRDAGITFFAYLVMAGLSDAPDRTLAMTELAVFASGSRSRLSHTVAKLEERGWVCRAQKADDRRVTLATLTDAGTEKLVATAPGHVAAVRRLVVDVLTPEQLAALATTSTAVLAELAGVDVAAVRRRLELPPGCQG